MTDAATLIGLAICFAPVFVLAVAACFHTDRDALPFRRANRQILRASRWQSRALNRKG